MRLLLFLLLIACKPATKDTPLPADPIPGPPGPVGQTGKPGSSCSTVQLDNGARIDCTDGTHSVVLNGAVGTVGPQGNIGQTGMAGERGADAPISSYAVTEIISPCPGTGYREVLLRLQNNTLLAHYSDGQKQFLSIIGPGTYSLTDGSNCIFTIQSNYTIIDEMGNIWNPS